MLVNCFVCDKEMLGQDETADIHVCPTCEATMELEAALPNEDF